MHETDVSGSFTFTECWWEAMLSVGFVLSIIGAVYPLLIWSTYKEYPVYKELIVIGAQAAFVGSLLFVIAEYRGGEHTLRAWPFKKRGAVGASLVSVLLSVWLRTIDALWGVEVVIVAVFLILFVTLIAVLLYMNRPTRS